MVNGEHLETFSLDASQLHPGRTHGHPWNRQASNLGPFLQKTLDRRSRHMNFDHISLHNSGVTRRLLRADTTSLFHCSHVLDDMLLNTESR